MSRIIDDPTDYMDLGALWDWSVFWFGLECGRMTDSELDEVAKSKHCPATDVAWLEIKRREELES